MTLADLGAIHSNVYVFGVNPMSGKIIWTNRIDGFDQKNEMGSGFQELTWSMGRGAVVTKPPLSRTAPGSSSAKRPRKSHGVVQS